MAFLAIVALVGLSAFSGASATCAAEGSSAVGGLVVGLAATVTGSAKLGTLIGTTQYCPGPADTSVNFCYGGNGSGSGRKWITGTSTQLPPTGNYPSTGPGTAVTALAFSDNDYSGAVTGGSGASETFKNGPVPASVSEFPIAIGAIAWHRNPTAGIPLTACLTLANMCAIFNQNGCYQGTAGCSNPLQYSDLNAAWPMVNVRPIIRGDSSGSTDATVAFLKTICSSSWSFPSVSSSGAANNAGVLTAIKTGGVMDKVATTVGGVNYANCNAVSKLGPTIEFALQNRRGTCVKCAQCTSVTPTPGAQCGIYSQFKIQSRLCVWSGVQPDGDKDGDSDSVVDLDQDGDGIGQYDFPTVFLEYAMMPTTVAPGLQKCCQLFQRLLVFLMNVNTQARFPPFGFYPLPAYVLSNSCKCMSQRKCGLSYAGIYASGVCH